MSSIVIRIEDLKRAFEDASELPKDEIQKAAYLLQMYKQMKIALGDYELSKKHQVNGLSLFDVANADGLARSGEHGRELHTDVTADSIVLKEKREAIVRVYTSLTEIIEMLINNLTDREEYFVSKLLFLDGMRYNKAQDYLKMGYKSDYYPLSETVFAVRRRSALSKITDRLKVMGILEYITLTKVKGKKRYVIRLSGWE